MFFIWYCSTKHKITIHLVMNCQQIYNQTSTWYDKRDSTKAFERFTSQQELWSLIWPTSYRFSRDSNNKVTVVQWLVAKTAEKQQSNCGSVVRSKDSNRKVTKVQWLEAKTATGK